jgi:GNAT superfamily N-acetyltransferase
VSSRDGTLRPMALDASPEVRRADGASPPDAAALAHLRYEWRATERGEQGLDRQAFTSEVTAWMADHRDTHHPFLAMRGVEPVGMAWLALVERIPSPAHFSRRSAYVQSVYVVPPVRGAGVGTALMGALLDLARELDLEYVAVHPSDRAFPLYRRLGFEDAPRVLELRR